MSSEGGCITVDAAPNAAPPINMADIKEFLRVCTAKTVVAASLFSKCLTLHMPTIFKLRPSCVFEEAFSSKEGAIIYVVNREGYKTTPMTAMSRTGK